METLNNKFSWGILTALFTFDAIVSYFGVTTQRSPELNLVIAPVVEKYPTTYFLMIPLEFLMIYIFMFIFRKTVFKLLLRHKFADKDTQEKIILGGAALYWFLANSSMNIIYVLGFRLPMNFALITWFILSIFGLLLSIIFVLIAVKRL